MLLFCFQAYSLPWKSWQDTKQLAKLNSNTQSLLRSSYCPYNCRFDRTSDGDTRFLRIEDGEAVLFEELNPGAISRIWMTSGFGTSDNLDNNIRIKFYFDGESTARIDLPLDDFFSGNNAPFVSPLVANRLESSGGNFSYVPIRYNQSVKITLTNAIDYMLWFQFNFHRLTKDLVPASFSLSDDFSDLANLLNQSGDVWQTSQIMGSGSITLTNGAPQLLYNSNQAGWIKSIKLDVDASYFDDIEIILKFDGIVHSQLKLSDFFSIGRNNGIKTQSLFLGINDNNQLYSNFPMPFHQQASISLLFENAKLTNPVVHFEVGTDNQTPNNNVGIFSTQSNNTCPSTPYIDTPILNLNNTKGKWVGIFSEFSSIGTVSRSYLEGDERIYIDGDTHPTHYGTGVEDFYNGGFYFDQGDLSMPLHGSPYHFDESATKSVTSAYRFMLTDGIEFQSSISAKLENGANGDLEMCAKSIAYYYAIANDNYQQIDEVDLGSVVSINSHEYSASTNETCNLLEANFSNEPATTLISNLCGINSGTVSFKFDNSINANNLRLRRLFDNSISNQVADIYINGIYQASFSHVPQRPAAYPSPPENPDRRWQQESLELGSNYTGFLNIMIIPRFGSTNYTAVKYELLGQIPVNLIFQNSF